MDSEDSILVADFNNHRIQKFTAQGEFLRTVGIQGSGPLRFFNSRGIAYSIANHKIYVGSWNSYIQILNSDLSYFGSFGQKGSDKGHFDYPQHICCDSTGNVYVGDYGNHRIQVFSADGEFLRMFGRHGEGRGELINPYGVAVDSNGRVYVSECGNHRISVFSAEGQFVIFFGSKGSGFGQFMYPHGLTVDASGVVYVCDSTNDRLQLF